MGERKEWYFGPGRVSISLYMVRLTNQTQTRSKRPKECKFEIINDKS